MPSYREIKIRSFLHHCNQFFILELKEPLHNQTLMCEQPSYSEEESLARERETSMEKLAKPINRLRP